MSDNQPRTLFCAARKHGARIALFLGRLAILPVDCLFCLYDALAVNLRKTGLFGRQCGEGGFCRPAAKYTNKWLFHLVICPHHRKASDEAPLQCTVNGVDRPRLLRLLLPLLLMGGLILGAMLAPGGQRTEAPSRDREAHLHNLIQKHVARAERAFADKAYDEALGYYERAISLDRDFQLGEVPKDSLYRAALCLEKTGQPDRAPTYYRWASLGPDGVAEAAQKVALTSYRSGNLSGAGELARRSLALGLDTAPVRAIIAESCVLAHDTEKAESHLQKALQQDPTAPIVQAAQARVLLATGRFDEARAVLSESGPHEDLPTWRLCRIDLLRSDGQPAEASRAMKKLINDFPEAPRLRVWRIESLLDAGRREEALGVARELQDHFSLPAEVELHLGKVLQTRHAPDDALASALKLIDQPEVSAGAHALAGNIYLDLGLRRRARWHAERALEGAPENADTLVLAARIAIGTGETPTALKHLRKTLRHAPNSAAPLHLLGMIHYRREDYPRALAHLKKACELAPQSGRFRYQYGRALAAAGQKEQAAEQLRKAIHLTANPYRAYTTLGMIHHERGEIAEAIQCYERATAANPGKAAEAYNNLAHIYLKQQDDPTPAVAFAHTARAVSPPETRGKMCDTLVSSLLRAGHGALAVRPARLAAHLDPDDPARRLRLGAVEAAAGNRAEAIQALKGVPILTDDPRLRKEAANLLTALREQAGEDR